MDWTRINLQANKRQYKSSKSAEIQKIVETKKTVNFKPPCSKQLTSPDHDTPQSDWLGRNMKLRT